MTYARKRKSVSLKTVKLLTLGIKKNKFFCSALVFSYFTV